MNESVEATLSYYDRGHLAANDVLSVLCKHLVDIPSDFERTYFALIQHRNPEINILAGRLNLFFESYQSEHLESSHQPKETTS
ncbi:hypothetical protein [Limnoglobus roseus]|uniref:Uncharacterized protein n=1 Tax=Limnoglobus roseus TaxID=2598579 RepID=A0A5C1AMG7_9BACT|nr:hypothetical protein [Limnoglobus roseus]QEL19327.1 hypothetical protein PX52LOC_06395 [Limnoglobus roseus]